MTQKIFRGVLLGSVLFISGFSTVSGEQTLPPKQVQKQQQTGEGFVMVPKAQMQTLEKEVREILKYNADLERALESAQGVIRNGMGCT